MPSTRLLIHAALAVTIVLAGRPAAAQPMTGAPGSPGATTTIQGDRIPAPPQKFGGKIERTTAGPKPYWPARIVPPKGAPNVLLIMTDDSDYGVPSTFGGVIPTPALEGIAGDGLRYTQGKPVFNCNLLGLKWVRWEGPEALAPGKPLEFDFKHDGPGMGTLERTIPLILARDENLDVGSDTGTPVDDKDYQVPFMFAGKINKITLTIDRPKLTPEDERQLMQAQRSNRVSE